MCETLYLRDIHDMREPTRAARLARRRLSAARHVPRTGSREPTHGARRRSRLAGLEPG